MDKNLGIPKGIPRVLKHPINCFIEKIRENDPDFISGYNILQFDKVICAYSFY